MVDRVLLSRCLGVVRHQIHLNVKANFIYHVLCNLRMSGFQHVAM